MDDKPRYNSPAVESAQTQLAKGPPLQDWSNRDLLSAILYWDSNRNPVVLVTERLGQPTASLPLPETDWLVWENEDYILYVSVDGTLIDLDTTVSGLEPALKALRWDLGMNDEVLSRVEYKALFAQGRAVGLVHKLTFTSCPNLKQFVMDYCNGQILCDHQVQDPSILGMVFLPLTLGAFSLLPKEGEEPSQAYLAEQSLVKDIGPEPERPKIPPLPVKPQYPPKPVPVGGWREPDPEQIKIIQDDIDWGVSSSDRLTNYFEEVRLHNVGVDYHHAGAISAWVDQKKDIDRAYKKELATHRKLVRSIDQQRKQFQVDLRHWKAEKSRQEALLRGFQFGYLWDLAVIYEQCSKAGPRSINGRPIFTSFQILNRADWERARKAIILELQHRESMEV